MGSSGGVHPVAAEGFDTVEGAAAYERGRPTYPPDAVAWLVETLGIGEGRGVLDLAAGTGKLTTLLVPTGARVVAVEPAAAMRERLATALPSVEVLDGTAEAIPLPDTSVDAATVAQAFHWFDGAPALRELHRVLRPGGGLALIWNARQDRTDWERRLREIVAELRGGDPWYESGAWAEPFGAATEFERLGERSFAHEQLLTLEGVVDRLASVSYVARLPVDRRAALLDGVRDMLATDPDAAGRDQLTIAYRTDVYCWRRRP